MLAYKGEAKVAIEIQWSPQTNEESLYRQERYRQSGVRCLWLFRRSGFPVSKDFPAACISGDLATGFKAHLGRQEMPMDEFFDAVFAKRFQYGVSLGAKAHVRIQSGVLPCWKCGVFTRIVTFIEIFVDPYRFLLAVADLTDFPDLLASCKERIPKAANIGVIKPRYSASQKRSYMSNGCYECDALIGKYFEHPAWRDEEATLAEFQITITKDWLRAIESKPYYFADYSWRVVGLDDSNRGD
ncbi:hypothetical protein ACH79_42145 [Bradyrhizobium sp. CCBAU 051011]|nr:hypothetical protein ACH79_42145 [Bradyrhizobium sp. CCBAU 051011]